MGSRTQKGDGRKGQREARRETDTERTRKEKKGRDRDTHSKDRDGYNETEKSPLRGERERE